MSSVKPGYGNRRDGCQSADRTAYSRTSGYIKAIRENDLVFALGPAGTGKTFLAVALAVKLSNQTHSQNCVGQAGGEAESLGFLPGDIRAKINPIFAVTTPSAIDLMSFEYMEKDVKKSSVGTQRGGR